MNFKASMTLQGLLGIGCGLVFLLVPELVLDFIAMDYTPLAVLLFRVLSLFVIILCAVLFFLRQLETRTLQKKVLLVNMLGDFLIAGLLLWATMEELLTHTGGWILSLFMLVNALSYVPVYWGLRGKG